MKRVRFLGEVRMKERISVWEGEGGYLNETSEKALTGTVNQIEWAKQIRPQVNAEFDRVITALETAAAKQSGQSEWTLRRSLQSLKKSEPKCWSIKRPPISFMIGRNCAIKCAR